MQGQLLDSGHFSQLLVKVPHVQIEVPPGTTATRSTVAMGTGWDWAAACGSQMDMLISSWDKSGIEFDGEL